MEIAMSKEKIESTYGLKFIFGSDGLGNAYSTYFNDAVLGTITIVCYEKSPNNMAIVSADSDIPFRIAIPRLLEVLNLESREANIPIDLG